MEKSSQRRSSISDCAFRHRYIRHRYRLVRVDRLVVDRVPLQSLDAIGQIAAEDPDRSLGSPRRRVCDASRACPTRMGFEPRWLKNFGAVPSYSLVVTACMARIDVNADPNGEAHSALVGAAIEQLQRWLPGRVVAVYVEQQFTEPAVARVSLESQARPADGFSLELRFASWLSTGGAAALRPVPTFLLPWLKVPKALVVPLSVDGLQRGAIVVEASKLGRRELDAIARLESELSDKLAEIEHSAPQGKNSERVRFAHSVRRIRTLV